MSFAPFVVIKSFPYAKPQHGETLMKNNCLYALCGFLAALAAVNAPDQTSGPMVINLDQPGEA